LPLQNDGQSKEFSFAINKEVKVSGKLRVACNEFTEMPKGQIAISFEGRS
jgi:hypothetical protein